MGNRRKISAFLLSVLGGCLVFSCDAKAQNTGTLTIEIDELRNQQGQLCYNLFSSSIGFPNASDKALKKECVKITKRPLTITLEGLKYGSYAVSVYHDENGDGKLNRNSLGIPTEGFGFSNNPFVSRGPAKFPEAVFIVAGQNTNIKIVMKYSINS